MLYITQFQLCFAFAVDAFTKVGQTHAHGFQGTVHAGSHNLLC